MQYPDVIAEVGDTIVFNYMRMHDVRAWPRGCSDHHKERFERTRPLSVAQVWAMPSASCGFENASELAGPDASPYRQLLTAPGQLHFSCSTSGHCAAGQLLTVNVVPAAAGPPPARQCARFLNTFASC